MGDAPFSRTARASFPLRLRLIWLAALTLPAVATAQPRYSWELSGSRLSGNTSDFETTAIGATHYFDRVEDGEAPYGLAAFFDPATFVSATLSRPGSNTDTWAVNGRYLLAPSRWYVGGEYTRYSYSDIDVDAKAYGVVAGKYLGRRTTLELALDTSKSEYTSILGGCSFAPCPVVSLTTIAEGDTASLSVVHVRQFRSLTYVLTGGLQKRDTHVTLIDNGSVPSLNFAQPQSLALRTYSVGATLYPTKKVGVNVGYEDTIDSGFARYTDGTYSVGARWFFRPRVAVEFSSSRTHLNDPLGLYGDARQRSFRIIGRF